MRGGAQEFAYEHFFLKNLLGDSEAGPDWRILGLGEMVGAGWELPEDRAAHPPVPTTVRLALPTQMEASWVCRAAWGPPGGTKGMVTAARHTSPPFPPTGLPLKA